MRVHRHRGWIAPGFLQDDKRMTQVGFDFQEFLLVIMRHSEHSIREKKTLWIVCVESQHLHVLGSVFESRKLSPRTTSPRIHARIVKQSCLPRRDPPESPQMKFT